MEAFPSWRQGAIRATTAASDGSSNGGEAAHCQELSASELRSSLQASLARLEDQCRTIAAHEARIARLEARVAPSRGHATAESAA